MDLGGKLGPFERMGLGPCGRKAIMATRDKKDSVRSEIDTTSAENEFQRGRRKVMIAGALLVPTIVTLHATPAWAQTDYRFTAYRYGANKGKCKNENYNPNANPNSNAGQEFIDCPDLKGRTHDDSGGPEQGSDPIVF
jgi:hypothetical protein